jgi:hypothetical protein
MSSTAMGARGTAALACAFTASCMGEPDRSAVDEQQLCFICMDPQAPCIFLQQACSLLLI